MQGEERINEIEIKCLKSMLGVTRMDRVKNYNRFVEEPE